LSLKNTNFKSLGVQKNYGGYLQIQLLKFEVLKNSLQQLRPRIINVWYFTLPDD